MSAGQPRGITRRAGAVLTTTVLVCSLAFAATDARAASIARCPVGLTASQQVTPMGGTAYMVCSGQLPSFDTTPLDTDVSIPLGLSGPLPLMVMLHGWGGSKTDLESTSLGGNGTNTWHWNNA